MSVHNPTSPCACHIEHNGNSERIVYCEKHNNIDEITKQRDQLLEACKDLNDYLNAVAIQLPVSELSAVLEKVKSSAEAIIQAERGAK